MSISDVSGVLPGVLVSVSLSLGLPDGRTAEVSTRVNDFEDADGARRLVVARPDLGGLAEPGMFPHEFRDMTLRWAQPTCQLAVRVAVEPGTRPYGPVWVLTPIGAPVKEQRRQYFRVPLILAATMAPTADDPRSAAPEVRATLVEISEGGAQVSTTGPLPPVGSFVDLTFTLDDETITVESEVLRHVTMPTGGPSAAIRFVDPTAYGDRIRRFAFSVQRTRARTPIS